MEALRREIRITEKCLHDTNLEIEVYGFFIDQLEGTDKPKRPLQHYLEVYESKQRVAARFESELKKLQEILKFAEEKEERELAS